MTFQYVSEESVSFEPEDPNTLTPETEPEETEKPHESESKQEEEQKPEKKPEEAKPEKPEEPEKKAELPKGVQKRINKLTARNYGLKRELAEREKRIAELEVQAGEKKLIEEIAKHAKTKPNKGDFESYEDYAEAKSKWDIREALLEERKTVEENKPEEKKDDPNELQEEIFKAGREAYEDFEEIVRNPELKLSETMFLAAMESDAAHEILYYLGTHPEEGDKIFALTPLQQAREIGKLETKLMKEQKPEEKKEQKKEETLDLSEQRKPQQEETKTTKAPPPIESVHGKSVTKKEPEKMSNEEYRNHRGYNRLGQRKG